MIRRVRQTTHCAHIRTVALSGNARARAALYFAETFLAVMLDLTD